MGSSKHTSKQMKKLFGSFCIIYGITLSFWFGHWAIKDNTALEQAVRAGSPQAEMRHRLNVFAEGVWFLLANLIVISGTSLAMSDKKGGNGE